mmetsp:Transcript_11341/g.17275  ORF Transcript_11341/g.17275 Transcript_11341/m.17275 type:complete len:239 (+) Transcript_11341:39-755(+)
MKSLYTMKFVAVEVIDLTSIQPGILKGHYEVSTCMPIDSTLGQRHACVPPSQSHTIRSPPLKRRRMPRGRARGDERDGDRGPQITGEYTEIMFRRLSDADINALHAAVDTQRTHMITMDTSLYSNADDTIKSAFCSRIRRVCPQASDQLIALVFTVVANQCQAHMAYLCGVNAITPMPTIQQMQGDIAALQHNMEGVRGDIGVLQHNMDGLQRNMDGLQRNMEEVQKTMSAILHRLPG